MTGRGRTAVILAAALAAGCATAPPRNPDNLCDIFREKDDWYAHTRAATERWGTPVSVQMAIIEQESSYQADVRPPRRWVLWIIPWTRPTSAYGYTQALDSTWDWYREETGNSWADRDDFDDAVDFVAWYVDRSYRMIGISRGDAYSQYLAYHEGQGGFKRRSYARKGWLKDVARRVNARATRYARQLRGCREELENGGWWPF